MIYKGDKKVIAIYKGDTPVKEVYKGNKKVFGDNTLKNSFRFLMGGTGASGSIIVRINNTSYSIQYVKDVWTTYEVETTPTSLGNMFSYSAASQNYIKQIDMENWDVSGVTSIIAMFNGCKILTSVVMPPLDVTKLTSFKNVFTNCSQLTSIKCKQSFKDFCDANKSEMGLTTSIYNQITWTIY